jgi:tetratricopeptide (TPR) repeat protein
VAKSRLNDLPGAIADYTAAINLGPNLEDAYEARGSAHTALRNEKEAADDFRRAMELRLKSSQASATH